MPRLMGGERLDAAGEAGAPALLARRAGRHGPLDEAAARGAPGAAGALAARDGRARGAFGRVVRGLAARRGDQRPEGRPRRLPLGGRPRRRAGAAGRAARAPRPEGRLQRRRRARQPGPIRFVAAMALPGGEGVAGHLLRVLAPEPDRAPRPAIAAKLRPRCARRRRRRAGGAPRSAVERSGWTTPRDAAPSSSGRVPTRPARPGAARKAVAAAPG